MITAAAILFAALFAFLVSLLLRFFSLVKRVRPRAYPQDWMWRRNAPKNLS
jgi:hypothetical protein